MRAKQLPDSANTPPNLCVAKRATATHPVHCAAIPCMHQRTSHATHLQRPAQPLEPLLLQLGAAQLVCLAPALLLQQLHLLLQELPLLHELCGDLLLVRHGLLKLLKALQPSNIRSRWQWHGSET